jgi:hypothetical protein
MRIWIRDGFIMRKVKVCTFQLVHFRVVKIEH